jgi:hypothetical protein
MSVTRSDLKGGPAKVTWNSGTFITRDGIDINLTPERGDVITQLWGRVDRYVTDRVFKINLMLWGGWENVAALFPAALLDPAIGTRLIGAASDLPLVILGRNGDQITFHNAILTKLADLYLGGDNPIWASAVEFTALLASGKNPEDASGYYTIATGQSYTEPTFTIANFVAQRYAAAWAGITGFTAFQAKEGWNVSWDLALGYDKVSGLGTVDAYVTNFSGRASCVPIGPTMANIETAMLNQSAIGKRLNAQVAGAPDLVITGASPSVSVTLKHAALAEMGFSFSTDKLRNGVLTWESQFGITAGDPDARAVIA